MNDLTRLLERGVSEHAAPGLAAAVLKPSGEAQVATAGVTNLDDPASVTGETIFYIASCTKPVTSVAALQLVERGLVDLDEPVGRFLPQLANPDVLDSFNEAGEPVLRKAKSPITLRHLLTHSSGLAYDFNSPALTRYLARRGLDFRQPEPPPIPLLFDPGEGWVYGVGIDWAGRLIEAVSGEGLDRYCASNIFEPLGMHDTAFFLSPNQMARKASVHFQAPNGGVSVVPFGMPNEPHFWMGGAGLSAPVADYMKFLTALAGGGGPLIGRAMFAEMMRNQVGDRDAGWITTADPMVSGDYRAIAEERSGHGLAGVLNLQRTRGGRAMGSMAWAGLTNCHYWVDPTSRAAGVLMSQVLPFGDAGVLDVFRRVEALTYA